MDGMGEISVRGELVAKGPAAAYILDDAQVATVGEGAKRFPVVATVNGYTWRTSVARMGGEFMVGLSKEVRTGARVEAGDTVSLQLKLDTEPRTWSSAPAPSATSAATASSTRAAITSSTTETASERSLPKPSTPTAAWSPTGTAPTQKRPPW